MENKDFENGLKEGNVCGQQTIISKLIYSFLNSKTAYENKITGLKVEVDKEGNYSLFWNFGERPEKLKREEMQWYD